MVEVSGSGKHSRAYQDMATVTAVKSFIVQAPAVYGSQQHLV